MIESFEGCVLKASNKLDGVWTIGYGQTGSYYGKRVRRGMTTTKAEAHAWLRDHSIKTYEDAVTQAVKVPLNQNQFDALVSFAYNVGVGALKQSTALRKLNVGDYAGAADALTMWTKCNGKVLAGLVRRRKEERALFLTPVTQTNTGNTDLLRKGDRGDDVKLLQHRLNLLGWQLTEDGVWGVPDGLRRERVPVPCRSDRGRHCRSKNQGGAHSGCNPGQSRRNGCVHGQAQVALPG